MFHRFLGEHFYVYLVEEAPWSSLRCQFDVQVERGEAVGCLCPPGLRLASDNKTCEGSASHPELPLCFLVVLISYSSLRQTIVKKHGDFR